MRLAALSLAVFSTLAVAQGAPDQRANDWLERFQQAPTEHDYKGIFVYERQGVFSTHQVWHQISEKGVSERYLQLNGPAYEVVYQNAQVVCSSADQEATATPERLSASIKLENKQLARFYAPSILGYSRVAGRNTIVLLLMPRDQHRYAYELYLDEQTSIPLMSLMLTSEGQLLERFQYASFELADIDLTHIKGSESCIVSPVNEATPVSLDWVPAWLPTGFLLHSAMQEFNQQKQPSFTSYSYTDGLASFSVFVEPLHGEVAEDILLQVGPTAIAARKVCAGKRDVMATVVGEIPIGTAERIAISVCSEEK
ncbi:MucB/RseB C-terminal domain-containing protein [Pseudomonas sp. F1_0610]|uniref:MucB/RseB C-terminal domain-containing protein n=1 Tax=Pseudomonas sp. F1_0610 TaxID=3114284 RepID=UPI0039C3B0DA